MRRIIDYANFGANHVGGMGSRRAAVCCIHLSYSSRSRARSLPVCLSFSLSARALSFHLALLLSLLLSLSPSALSLILAPFLALILFLSFAFSLSLKKDRIFNELKAVFAASSTLPTGSERKTLRVSKGEEGS